MRMEYHHCYHCYQSTIRGAWGHSCMHSISLTWISDKCYVNKVKISYSMNGTEEPRYTVKENLPFYSSTTSFSNNINNSEYVNTSGGRVSTCSTTSAEHQFTDWAMAKITRSTRPIDAKLWKKLCLRIMFNIKISLHQKPPYLRSKILKMLWNLG